MLKVEIEKEKNLLKNKTIACLNCLSDSNTFNAYYKFFFLYSSILIIDRVWFNYYH